MSDSSRNAQKVIVIGAGLAGLCCARSLQRAGFNAHVFEQSDRVGGRVATDFVDGFRLDRGFQVLFTAYPAVKQELDLAALDLKVFDPGMVVFIKGEPYPLYDPFRQPLRAISSLRSPLLSYSDNVALFKFRQLVMRLDIEDIFLLPDVSAKDYLLDFGLSRSALDDVVVPISSGIFLHRRMDVGIRNFAMVYKMMAEGSAAVPAAGMGAIPEQIAASIEEGTIHLNSSVTKLIKEGDRVIGVELENGDYALADFVVVAASADVAALLTGLNLPQEKRSAACLYIEIPKPFTSSKSIMLFQEPNKYATSNTLVNNAVIISNVAPSYAESGRHLLSATSIGDPQASRDRLLELAQREIGGHFKDSRSDEWELVHVYRIPWAQFAQPAGISSRLPKVETGIPGLILSGEIVTNSSIQGALQAGQKAANAVFYATGMKRRPVRR